MRRQTRSRHVAVAALLGAAAIPVLLAGQAREVTTTGFDAQRSNWIRTDVRINRASVEDGTFTFLWKHTFAGNPRQLNSLTQPVLQDFLVGYKGFKSLAVMGSADDVLFAIDTDLAKPMWTTHLTYAAATGSQPGSTWECPGGMMAAPSRWSALAPTSFAGGGGAGQRAISAVGEPGKGAAVMSQPRVQRRTPPPTSDPPPPPPGGPARKVPGVAFGGVDPLWVMGSDGILRTVRITDGWQMEASVPFLPPNARPSSLIYVDGFVLTSTSNGCGNAPNAVWSIDLLAADTPVKKWETGGANIAGTSGPALGTSGLVYAATGPQPPDQRPWLGAPAARHPDSVVALDRTTLELKDAFTAPGADFATSPTVFRYKGQDYVTVAARDGRVFLLDGAALGGADRKTPLFATAPVPSPAPGPGLATWQDADGVRWVLAPIGGKVSALKVVERDGKLALEAAWQSRELASPLAPVVVNGLVFAVASGEHRGEPNLSAAERAKRSTPAVLYVLDGATGKELWSSGKTIGSFARAGLAAGGGQVYVVTHDHTLYAFGIPLEH